MRHSASLHRAGLRICIAIATLLTLSAAAAAQTPATSKSRRARVAQASTTVESVPPLDQPVEEPVFRFRRPIVRIGQDYTLRAGDVVREIDSGLADITIEGQVEQDVAVVVGSLHLASTANVGGSVVVVGGTLTIDPGASVGRDLVVVGGTLNAPAGFSPQGQQVVVGSVAVANALHGLVPWITRGLALGRMIVPDVQWIWMAVAIIFFIYLMVNALFGNPVRSVADTVSAKPLSSFLLGLLVLVLTVPALAILAATVVGLAVIPFVLCALVVAAVIGKVGVIRTIGRGVLPESAEDSRLQSFRSLIIGFVVLTIAYMIPVLGFITWAITGVVGLGAATVTFRAALRREHPARVREAEPGAAPASIEPRPAIVAEPAVVAPASTFVPEAEAAAAPAAAAPPPPRAEATSDLAVYPRATFLDRVAAFALDVILVAIAVNLLDLTRHGGWFPLVLLSYHIAFWAWRGTTLGGIIVGLRVIRVDGTNIRFVDALVRGLSSIFSIAALGIGCLWMLQDPEKQMWHDKIAGTLVVKVPRHLVLP